ncbi:MAG: type II toxin-antitoxin system PemK/MazF family toxin [Candidatus Margulisbacteria bacterium]|jgi:mRNA interferase MazF|nr:type II toxin-antitoxin system PemK/MazF family toxin [Candidatus Margulisiibacteriota bacterium]
MMRGEIWWADLGLPFGSETGFKRPVLILQNDAFNRSRINTVVVVPFTTNLALADAPGNVYAAKTATKLPKDSVVVVSQVVAIDKKRLIKKRSRLTETLLAEVETGLLLTLGIA